MKHIMIYMISSLVSCFLLSCEGFNPLPSPNETKDGQIELTFEVSGPENKRIDYGSLDLVFSEDDYLLLPDSSSDLRIKANVILGTARLGIDPNIVSERNQKVYFLVRALPNEGFGIYDTLTNRQDIISYNLKNNNPKAHSIKVKLSEN